MRHSFVYIMTNYKYGTLYIGVTNNLVRRAWEHKAAVVKGFSAKYGLTHLVYFELFDDIYGAIKREKALKNWKRAWKLSLIDQFNPGWVDLFNSLI